MNFNLRCTGGLSALFLLACWPFGGLLQAQQPEALFEGGEYVAAAKAFAALGTREGDLSAGLAWYQADSLQRALDAYKTVTTDANGTSIKDSLTGLAFHKTGLIYYDVEDDRRAANYYLRAIAVRDEVFPGPHNDRAHSRNNLATSLRYLGKLDSAALIIRESIGIYEKLPVVDSLNWLRSLNELADIAVKVEDFQLANSSFIAARGLLENMSGVDSEDAFYCYYLGARTNMNFGANDAAITNARRAIELAETSNEPIWLADALTVLAGSYKEKGDAVTARAAFSRAAKTLTDAGHYPARLAFVYFSLSSMAANEDDHTTALDYLEESKPLIAEANTNLQLEYIIRKAFALTEMERMPEAITLLNEGVEFLTGQPVSPDTELPDLLPDSIAPHLYTKASRLIGERANALLKLDRNDEALADYETYLRLLDLLRGRVNSDASRRYLSQNHRFYFDRAIAILLDTAHAHVPTTKDRWRAFEYSERAKAYSLLTALQKNRNAMPLREATLRTRIAELERETATRPEAVNLLEAARLQLDRIIEQGRKDIEIPDFTFDRSGFTALLAEEGTDLIAYHLGREANFLFLISSDGTITTRALNVNRLSTDVRDWRESIEAGAFRRKSLRPTTEQVQLDERFLMLGNSLRQLLLPDQELSSRVCIVPDGALNFLPFAALPTVKASLPLDYATLGYLQTGREITYSYSARFLLELEQLPAVEYSHNLVAFAPSFRGVKVTAPHRSIDHASLRALPGLSPLRFNQPEVEEISEILPASRSFYGAEANRGAFIDELGSGRIVHLSSHGMVNAANPNLSFIAFSQLGDSLELEELLYFNDLSALPLTTELAVLSACETSLGEYIPGESTLSLASAFAAAGARSTLTTLWSVDDEATKELMVRFYRELAGGAGRGEALARAQAAHRKGGDFSHPYYWSAMTLYGASGPLELEPAFPIPWWQMAGGGLLLLLGGLFALRKKRS